MNITFWTNCINHYLTMKVKKVHTTEMPNMLSCLKDLEKSGYHTQFQFTHKGLLSRKSMRTFNSDEVKSVKCFRFEENGDPNDNAILFALDTSDRERGTLVDGYGIFGNPELSNFMKEVESLH